MTDFRFALRRASIVTVATAAMLIFAACSSTTESSQPAGSGSGGTVAVQGGAVTITAASLAFDANVIQATAGEAFTVTLVNNDSAPHNFSIYTEEGGDALVQGDTAEAGQTVTIEVDALDAGTYFFKCDIHPDMNGSVEVAG